MATFLYRIGRWAFRRRRLVGGLWLPWSPVSWPHRTTFPRTTPKSSLTPREREMVALVATGLSNQEIAERMFLSPFTVRAHVQRAMTQLDARDRARLVVIAYRTGLARAAAPDGGTDPLS